MQLFQFLFIEKPGLLRHQLFLSFLIILLYAFNALTTNLQNFFQNFVKDLGRSGDQSLLSYFGSDLEQTAIHLVNRQLFDCLLCSVNFIKLSFDLVFIQKGDRNNAFGREQLLQNMSCRLLNEMAEAFELIENIDWLLGCFFDKLCDEVRRVE